MGVVFEAAWRDSEAFAGVVGEADEPERTPGASVHQATHNEGMDAPRVGFHCGQANELVIEHEGCVETPACPEMAVRRNQKIRGHNIEIAERRYRRRLLGRCRKAPRLIAQMDIASRSHGEQIVKSSETRKDKMRLNAVFYAGFVISEAATANGGESARRGTAGSVSFARSA